MTVFGITGPIGSGKSTFGKLLDAAAPSARHFESWKIIAEVATQLKNQQPHPLPDDLPAINRWLQALPDYIERITGKQLSGSDFILTLDILKRNPEHYLKLLEYLSAVQANPGLATLSIDNDTKQQFRSLLQWLGGYIQTLDHTIWYDEIVRRIQQGETYDLVTIGGVRYPADAQALQAIGAKIIQIERPSLAIIDGADLTERDRSAIEADVIIVNNGALTDLAIVAKTLLKDATDSHLRPRYVAH